MSVSFCMFPCSKGHSVRAYLSRYYLKDLSSNQKTDLQTTGPVLFSLLIHNSLQLEEVQQVCIQNFFSDFFITQCAVVWRLTEYLKMKIKCAFWLYLAILSSTFFALVNGLNFFTATVDPPDSQYSQLLSGNDVFETVYSTFNSTGLLLLGSALLLSSGK